MQDQLSQELEERNQLKVIAKVSEREVKLQARLFADATSGYDKKRIGLDKVDAEAQAAMDASKAQRQTELTIVVSEKTDEVRDIMVAARQEEAAAAAAIEECHAAEAHTNDTRAGEWAEHAREKELREGPHFATTLEQLERRLGDTQAALDLGKTSLQEKVGLAQQSQAVFLRQHALQRLLHLAHRLEDEQSTERLKARNHGVIKRATLAHAVWSEKADLFHKTDDRAKADEEAAEKQATRHGASAIPVLKLPITQHVDKTWHSFGLTFGQIWHSGCESAQQGGGGGQGERSSLPANEARVHGDETPEGEG